MRVVSLLPSTTEILFAVGAGKSVVGVTFECDFPAEARERRVVSTSALVAGLTPAEIDASVAARIGSGEDLYKLDAGALRDLDPDVILTQDLCAVCAVDVTTVDDALSHLGCRAEVVTIDPMTLDAVLESIIRIGEVVGCRESGNSVVSTLRDRIETIEKAVADRPRPRVAVLEWTDPPFTAGHWVPDMVDAAGGLSVLGRSGERSERTTWDALRGAAPDVIVVAPCGYHLAPARALAETLCASENLPPGVPVWAVDADAAFVRPGPRLVDGVEALAHVLHGDAVPPRPEVAVLIRS
jgi:iron complex transport system substrate-binding protein